MPSTVTAAQDNGSGAALLHKDLEKASDKRRSAAATSSVGDLHERPKPPHELFGTTCMIRGPTLSRFRLTWHGHEEAHS